MTIKDLARDTYEKISDINDYMGKIRFLAEEITDSVNPIASKTEQEDMQMYYYNKERHCNYSEILLDYVCNVEKEIKKILEYLDSPQFEEESTDGEKGLEGSSTTGK